MPTLTINGKSVSVEKGTTIMKAAEKLDIYIPHFCYHPYLSVAGNCRMCLVEIEGWPKLAISCATEAQDGMVVKTDSPRVLDTVRGVLELLLLNHPVDCPICDQAGECKLQDYYMEYGFHESRMELSGKLHKAKVVDLGEMVVLDAERCVLCSACVRFCQEVSKTHELQFFHRGNRTEIGTFDGRPLSFGYAGNLADLCPVGALTSKDFRFKCRVWFLQGVESVCAECSTGCNIRVDHQNGTIYRFVPRENILVNKVWMCDAGRLSYKQNSSPRLSEPTVLEGGERKPIPWNRAYELFKSKATTIQQKHGKESLAVIVSARATNEELFLVRKLAADVLKTPALDFRVNGTQQKPAEMEDAILRRVDAYPNSTGAAALGIGSGGSSRVPEMLASAAEGKIKFLLIVGGDVMTRYPDQAKLNAAIAHAEFVVLLASFAEELRGDIDLVLPEGTYLETDGTFTNYQGRVQRIRPALLPPGSAKEGWRILAELHDVFGPGQQLLSGSDVFELLAKEEKTFAGLTYESIGSHGVLLDGRLL